jgi:signal transduction histidine kinase
VKKRKSAPKEKNWVVNELKEEIRVLKRKLWVAERLRHDAVMKQRGVGEQNFLDGRLLAAGVAHEFNNILGAADGHAEWALETGSPSDMKEALKVVRQACARSLQITKSLQGMQAPEEESVEVFDLRQIGRDLEKHFLPWSRKKRILFEIKLPEVKLYGNEARLYEVLVNLIKNAFEACEESQAKMPKDSEAELYVRVGAKVDETKCKIWVEDSGPGIPDFLREKIFQPFFTTKGRLSSFVGAAGDLEGGGGGGGFPVSSSQGSGLGLFLSRSIVKQMGGRMSLAKTRVGTRFQLILPLAP